MSPSAAAQRRAAGSEALRSRQSLARPVVEEADGGGGDAEDGAAWRMCSNGPSGVLHIGANEARGSRQRRRRERRRWGRVLSAGQSAASIWEKKTATRS